MKSRISSDARRNISASTSIGPRSRWKTLSGAILFEVIEWVGWDKLLFATDYPHWDYDDPSRVLPAGVSDANREAFYLNNALKLYGLA